MHRFLFVVLAAVLILALGCQNPLESEMGAGSEQEGAVVLVFSDERAKTLVPEISLVIANYEVSFTRTGFQPVFISNLPGDTMLTEPVSLRPGLWTVTVDALNEAADIIGIASAEVLVKARQTSTSSLVIRSPSGNGTLSLSADLSGVELISPTISGVLISGVSGEEAPISLDITGTTGSYTGIMAAGTYLLALELVDDGGSVAQYVNTVLIAKDVTTTGSLVLKAVMGSVVVELTNRITRPIVISLVGLLPTLGTEESMTVSANPSVAVDSYQWYLDGEELAGQTNSQVILGPGLLPGQYALSVVVKKGAVYSSQSDQFTVAPQEPSAPKLQPFGVDTVYIRLGSSGATIPPLEVSLDSPAISDTVIDLTYSDSNISGPPTAIIPAGSSTSQISVSANISSTDASTLKASYLGDETTVAVRVYNDAEVRVLSSISPSSQSIPVNGTGTLTITLDLPAPPGGATVNLTATTGVVLPASVLIPQDALSASVTVTAGGSEAVAIVEATLNSSVLTAQIYVD